MTSTADSPNPFDDPSYLESLEALAEHEPQQANDESWVLDELGRDPFDLGRSYPNASELVAGLNPRQREAVEHHDGPLLVVAGPGSGKTRVLTHRIAMLLTRGVRPWEILAVTFTNKAAEEMRERLVTLVGPEAVSAMWVSTFHSACVKILRREHAAAGLPRSFSIVDADDAERIVRRVLKSTGTVAGATDKELDAEARAYSSEYHDAISMAKNKLMTPDQAEKKTGLHNLSIVMNAYQEYLAAMGGADFDDLLVLTLRILQDHGHLREKYQRKFRHVLVDEFQDTNAVQLALTDILSGGWGNLCVVGDQQQAIYSWRGAHPAGLNQFTDDRAEAKVVVLDQNYRSTPAILEVCQSVIDQAEMRHRTALWTDNPDGEPVVAFEASDDRDEAAWVVRRFSEVRSTGATWSDCAVLSRTNAQTRPIEDALRDAGIPYKVVGGLRFYERAEVKDALSYLRLAVNGVDVVSFERAATTPRRGVGPKTQQAAIEIAESQGLPLVDAVAELAATGPSRSAPGLSALAEAVQEIARAAQRGAAAAVETAVMSSGLREHYQAQPDGDGRVENLDELVSAAASFVANDTLTVDGTPVSALDGFDQTLAFLEHVALVSAADEIEGAQVHLMTIHAAKGREFRFVAVVGLEEELLPHKKSLHSRSAMDEERRLMFVACSRAMERLWITWCRSRYLFGRPIELPPSRFLGDLPESVVREVSPRTAVPSRSPFGQSAWNRRPVRPASKPVPSPRPSGGVPKSLGARPGPVSPAKPAALKPQSADRVALDDLSSGDQVEHDFFGRGTVSAVLSGAVKIRFGNKEKVLDPSMAPMRKVS